MSRKRIIHLSDAFLTALADASSKTGLAESTICNRLFGNTTLPVAARARAEKTKAQIAALELLISTHQRTGKIPDHVSDYDT